MKLVPEPSARRTTEIAASGKATPGFKAVSAGSFHFTILPRKISPSSGPVSLIWPGWMPLMLTTGTTPPITVGNCTKPSLASASSLSGMSDAPKSTVLLRIWFSPAPDPTDW